MYAGRDGNVYRRNDAGGWDQNNGSGGWEPAGGTGRAARSLHVRDDAEAGQLDRDSGARTQGNTRTADRGGWQSGGSTRSGAGSYGGGGRSRGGGGRRR